MTVSRATSTHSEDDAGRWRVAVNVDHCDKYSQWIWCQAMASSCERWSSTAIWPCASRGPPRTAVCHQQFSHLGIVNLFRSCMKTNSSQVRQLPGCAEEDPIGCTKRRHGNEDRHHPRDVWDYNFRPRLRIMSKSYYTVVVQAGEQGPCFFTIMNSLLLSLFTNVVNCVYMNPTSIASVQYSYLCAMIISHNCNRSPRIKCFQE